MAAGARGVTNRGPGATTAELCARIAARFPTNRYVATTPRRLERLLAEMDALELGSDGRWRLTRRAELEFGLALRELVGDAAPDPTFGLHRRRRRAA
jgi:hypothetical protein